MEILGETNDKDFCNLYDLFQSKNLINAFLFWVGVMVRQMSFPKTMNNYFF